MAYQVEYQDGTRQWLPGGLPTQSANDLQKIAPPHIARVISCTPDWNVAEWRRWKPGYVTEFLPAPPTSHE